MRLRRIEIENYGLYSDVDFDFDDGFQLIFGPNEAGKSTLLQLIREVLFGFPTRSPYAFSSHAGEMAATATLQMADDTQVRYRRRKGRKNEVVGKTDPGGRDLDASALSRLLGGADIKLYEQVFGFSLAELSSGEQSLQQANLNEALYGGGLGGLSNFQDVQANLKKEADSLFTARSTTKTINSLLKRIKETAAEQRRAIVKPADYKNQLAACEEFREKVEQLSATLDRLQTRENHLQRIDTALQPWRQLQADRNELAGLEVPDGLAPDAAEQLDRLKARRDELTKDLVEIENELTENRTELSKLEWNPNLLTAAERIRSLNRTVGEIEGFRRDKPLREAESKSIKDQVLARLRELNPAWDLTQLERFRTSLEQRQTIERLEQQWDEVNRRRADLASRQPALEDDLGSLRDRLTELGKVELPERFEVLIDGEAAYKSNQKTRQTVEDNIERLTRETQKLKDKLNGPLQTQLEFTERLPVPLVASVTDFQQRWSEANNSVRQATQELDRVKRELRENHKELELLNAQEAVPDQQELQRQRQHRDAGWTLIRTKYIEEGSVEDETITAWTSSAESTIADEYERSVVQADDVADQRQTKAVAAAKHDQLTQAVTRLEDRVSLTQAELSESRAQAERLQAEWAELWRPCSFTPLQPDAMRQWLEQYKELETQQDRLGEARQDLIPLVGEIQDFESQLKMEFPDSTDLPMQLLVRAKRAVRTARENEGKRKSYAEDLPKKERELKRIAEELSKVAEQEEDWRARWQEVLAEFGFPTTWDVDVATRILTGLSEARSDYGSTVSLDQRIRDMQTGIVEFEQAASDLCQELAPDLIGRPAEFAVEELSQRLEHAIQSQENQGQLKTSIEKLTKRVDAKRKQQEEAVDSITTMLNSANAASEPEFLELAADAERKAELDRRIAVAMRELMIHRSTEPEDQFEEELARADADSIANELRRLQQEIRAAKADRDKLLEEKALADRARDEMESASQAAGLAMDLESGRSELATAIDRWAPLVMAQSLMKRAIEKFEHEHQPAMMGEVQRLFRQLTLERYVAIERKLDEHGTLLVVQQDGKRKEPAALSTGTREQLYLAIRLAYIIHYCRDAEPLPIVMDDVLVNFDDERADQTLKVLLEVAANVQILFLTCHQHVVQLYQRIDPNTRTMTLEAK